MRTTCSYRTNSNDCLMDGHKCLQPCPYQRDEPLRRNPNDKWLYISAIMAIFSFVLTLTVGILHCPAWVLLSGTMATALSAACALSWCTPDDKDE